MGLYSNNRTSLSEIEAPALEYANCSTSFAVGLLENAQDDLKFFNTIIARDFQEAAMNVSGSVNESSVEALTEGTLADIFNKIKEMLKKLWAKIKSIVDTFIAKINGVVMKDNKALVEKYRKQINKKDFRDMKYTWSEPTGKEVDVDAMGGLYDTYEREINECDTPEEVSNWFYKNDDYADMLYGKLVGQNSGVTSGEFAKEVHELYYNDPEKMDSDGNKNVSYASSILLNASTTLKDLNHKKSSIERGIKKLVKLADDEQKAASRAVPSKEGTDPDVAKTRLAKANAKVKLIGTYDAVTSATMNAILKEIQFNIKQCRAIWIKAATYNDKAKNENAILFDAIEESVEWDVESTFADYSI